MPELSRSNDKADSKAPSQAQDGQALEQQISPDTLIRRAQLSSQILTPRNMLQLQRIVGNRTASRILHTGSAAPTIQTVRKTQPENLSENYSDLVQQAVSEDIGEIIEGEGEPLEKDNNVWKLLKGKFNHSATNGARYLGQLIEAIAVYKGQVGQDPEEGQKNKARLVAGNEEKREDYDSRYRDYYQTQYQGDDGDRVRTRGYDPEEDGPIEGELDDDDASYQNMIEKTEEGQFYIKADANYAEADEAPKRLPNSEIFWQQLQGYLKEVEGMDDGEVLEVQRGLPFLERGSISNGDTQAVIYMCMPDGADVSQVHSFAAVTPEFNALLGTENGRAAMYLAKDHLDQIEKTITHVETCIEEPGGWVRFYYGPI